METIQVFEVKKNLYIVLGVQKYLLKHTKSKCSLKNHQ